MPLTHARLLELLNYDPATGIFTSNLGGKGRRPIGTQMGSINKISGYVEVRADYKLYLGHRLAFFWMKGYWPTKQIDHRNGIRSDNSWDNLRDASQSMNSQNLGGPMRNNKCRLLGVSLHKATGLYRAVLWADGRHHVKYRKTPEAAYEAYLKMKNELHPTHERLKGITND